jgi:hypothetical protein
MGTHALRVMLQPDRASGLERRGAGEGRLRPQRTLARQGSRGEATVV